VLSSIELALLILGYDLGQIREHMSERSTLLDQTADLGRVTARRGRYRAITIKVSKKGI
jgi:hypothetical protein